MKVVNYTLIWMLLFSVYFQFIIFTINSSNRLWNILNLLHFTAIFSFMVIYRLKSRVIVYCNNSFLDWFMDWGTTDQVRKLIFVWKQTWFLRIWYIKITNKKTYITKKWSHLIIHLLTAELFFYLPFLRRINKKAFSSSLISFHFKKYIWIPTRLARWASIEIFCLNPPNGSFATKLQAQYLGGEWWSLIQPVYLNLLNLSSLFLKITISRLNFS